MRLRTALLGFSDEELVTGDEESQRRARAELRRQQRRHFAENSNWPLLTLADLRFERFHVEPRPSGERYRIHRGEVMDAVNVPVVAWFIRAPARSSSWSVPDEPHRAHQDRAGFLEGSLRRPDVAV